MAEYRPIHFFDEQVEVLFDNLPVFEKTPDCPNGFVWEEKTYRIVETLSEWSDFTRRGKYARNMRPTHAAVASNRGSLNVGRFYFRVKAMLSSNTITEPTKNQIFDLYYDRAMKSVDERKGQWFLYRELAEK
jgi:hypothetical protein